MAQLTTSNTLDLTNVKASIAQALYDPTSLIKATLTVYDDLTGGVGGTVDPSNPMILLTEMGAVLSSSALQESLGLYRRAYPALASTDKELYYHMSDVDYLDRFASPAFNEFFFAMDLASLNNNMLRDEAELCDKIILPRNSVITIDGYVFTLLYPVVIRRFDNGSVTVSYDTSIISPIYTPTTLAINYAVSRDLENNAVVLFEAEMAQVEIISSEYAIDRTSSFRQTITYPDSFCYIRAFYKKNGAWVEMLTTHNNVTYDSLKPTLLAKVYDGSVNVELPSIYQARGLVSNQIRIDVYCSKGEVDFAANQYPQDSVELTFTPIDDALDVSPYSTALQQVSIYCGSRTRVTGGKAALSFEQLRNRTIYNANGPRETPITATDIIFEGQRNGFDIIPNVDLITSRIFVGTRRLPKPSNDKLLTPANIGMITFHSSLEDLSLYPNVIRNQDRATILSETLFRSDDGVISMLSQADIDALYALTQNTLVAVVNSSQFFYTPFYYVLDNTGSEFDLRAYDLDRPYATARNFVRQNQTLQLSVNIGEYHLAKTNAGYRLSVVTRSGDFYKEVPINMVGIQLAFYPDGEKTLAYINAVLDEDATAQRTDGEYVFFFDIETNHDFDSNDRICITNAEVEGVAGYTAWINLETSFYFIHWTNNLTPSYVADETDTMLGKFMLPLLSAGNVLETITLTLGKALDNLWRRSRNYFSDVVYKTHTTDIPATYEEDVYEVFEDGTTIKIVGGEVVRNKLHSRGEIQYTTGGDVVYRFRVGDAVLDSQGNPIIIQNPVSHKDIDLLVVDARYYFATDPVTVAYRTEIADTLTDWITDGLDFITDRLLEKTNIYFYPKTTLGTVQVYTENDGIDYLPAEQALTVNLYVSKSVSENPAIRENVRSETIRLLDYYIAQSVINISDITDELRKLYGSLVKAFDVSGLGGGKNYRLLTVASSQNKLCLLKELTVLSNGTMTVVDAVKINFNVIKSSI